MQLAGTYRKCAKLKITKCSKHTKHIQLKKLIKWRENYLLQPILHPVVVYE